MNRLSLLVLSFLVPALSGARAEIPETIAAPGEVLVSQTVRDLARTPASVSFEDRGERELKGVSEPVRVFALVAS